MKPKTKLFVFGVVCVMVGVLAEGFAEPYKSIILVNSGFTLAYFAQDFFEWIVKKEKKK